MSRCYPIIEYSHMIGKNTADLTAKDLAAFMKWWMKQPVREDLLSVTPAQRITYEKDVQAMNKFRAAQTSRLPVGIDETTTYNDNEDEAVEDTIEQEEEIVVEMGLTHLDVEALMWGLDKLFKMYDTDKHMYGASLRALSEGLKEFMKVNGE